MKDKTSYGLLWIPFFFGVLIGLALTSAFVTEFPKSAYVAPCRRQYCVYIDAVGIDPVLTKPVSLEEATKVADEINKTMNGRWNGGTKE